jgi:hypothetical protein
MLSAPTRTVALPRRCCWSHDCGDPPPSDVKKAGADALAFLLVHLGQVRAASMRTLLVHFSYSIEEIGAAASQSASMRTLLVHLFYHQIGIDIVSIRVHADIARAPNRGRNLQGRRLEVSIRVHADIARVPVMFLPMVRNKVLSQSASMRTLLVHLSPSGKVCTDKGKKQRSCR